MGAALARHDEILQKLIAQHGGRILRHRGDGFSVVFEDGQPLECVIAAQKQLVAEDWGEIEELRVCMALHAGEAERREFDTETIGQREEYFGPVLNRTAHILAAGSGGQILLTPEIVDVCQLPVGATLQDLGQHLLKSLDTPQQIFGLLHPDLPV
jgi:class 3 adenylate cyclase